jgi:hypothetical protein
MSFYYRDVHIKVNLLMSRRGYISILLVVHIVLLNH